MELDYDLSACLEYNPQDEFEATEIAEVLAVYDGANDDDAWRWILRLNDGRFIFLLGWCDYTGWDCQSFAVNQIIASPEDALPLALSDELWSEYYGSPSEPRQDVYDALKRQLAEGKDKTWRENKDDEFGHPPFVK